MTSDEIIGEIRERVAVVEENTKIIIAHQERQNSTLAGHDSRIRVLENENLKVKERTKALEKQRQERREQSADLRAWMAASVGAIAGINGAALAIIKLLMG